jgi:hypothetical protein
MICVRSRASGCLDRRQYAGELCCGGAFAWTLCGWEGDAWTAGPVAVLQVQDPTNLCSSSILVLFGQTKENSPLPNWIRGMSLSPSSDCQAN